MAKQHRCLSCHSSWVGPSCRPCHVCGHEYTEWTNWPEWIAHQLGLDGEARSNYLRKTRRVFRG